MYGETECDTFVVLDDGTAGPLGKSRIARSLAAI
jgi:hypothetical protein